MLWIPRRTQVRYTAGRLYYVVLCRGQVLGYSPGLLVCSRHCAMSGALLCWTELRQARFEPVRLTVVRPGHSDVSRLSPPEARRSLASVSPAYNQRRLSKCHAAPSIQHLFTATQPCRQRCRMSAHLVWCQRCSKRVQLWLCCQVVLLAGGQARM
jgi:hypothetical protein